MAGGATGNDPGMHLAKEDGRPAAVGPPPLRAVDPRDPRGSTDALAQLLREGDIALFSRSIDGERVHYVSENVHRVLGYTASEVMGTRCFVADHIHPEDRGWYQDQSARLSTSGARTVRDFRFRNRDGSYRWIRGHARAAREPGGEDVLVGYLSDVTEQKQLEKGIELQARALQALADAVLVVDEGGRILDWNQGADLLFGVPAAEVLGRSAAEVFGPGWWAIDPRIVAEADAGRTWRGEVDWRRPDGSSVVISATMVGVEATCGGRLYVATGHDITELRSAYTQVHAAHLQRKQLVSQLLHAEDTERQRIARDVHDDPIQAMTGLQMRLSLLRRRTDDDVVAGEVTTLEDIVTECIRRMRNMVFELHPRSLGETDGLSTTLHDLMHHVAETTGARTRVRYDLAADPDEMAKVVIYRVVLEAIANIRKHARAEEIEIGLSAHDGGYLVRIRDDGEGFEADDRPSEPGHIGLTSMQERAEGAGGRLRVDSRVGVGTTVEMWLPADAEGLDAAPASPSLSA